MDTYRLAVVAAGIAWAGIANAADAPKWGAHIDVEGKVGTKRNLGEVDLFWPVLQDADTLVFADIRSRIDDNHSREGNFGLGIRHMLESGWNLGGYAFFDRRRSQYLNFFNQVTMGAEALSLDWDFRANGYVPVGRTKFREDSLNTATISGASVIFRGGEERSLGGFDAEIGWRLPIFAADAGQQLRVYAGGYRFADEGVPSVAGPRGRAEMVFDEVPGLWDGSRLALGAEVQHDDPRGGQGFISARLRIPLQAEIKASRLTPMERRMADPIVRDIDVVSRGGAFGTAETATTTGGGNITAVSSSTTTGANLQTAVTNAGANSVVLLSGTFSTTSAVTLQSGQTMMGSGSLTVRSPSGRTATLTITSTATISATTTGITAAVSMANNSTLTGMTISQSESDLTGGPLGVLASGVSGAAITGNSISVTTDFNNAIGIRILSSASNITARGNTITAKSTNAGGGNTMGFFVQSSSATINGNTVSASGAGGNNNAFYLDTANIQSGSTGNVVSTGTCNVVTGGGGTTIGYTSGGVSGTCGP